MDEIMWSVACESSDDYAKARVSLNCEHGCSECVIYDTTLNAWRSGRYIESHSLEHAIESTYRAITRRHQSRSPVPVTIEPPSEAVRKELDAYIDEYERDLDNCD